MTNTETGLPEVPEGYFWRIQQGAFSIYRIELRRKRWIGSARVDSAILDYYDAHRQVLEPRVEAFRKAQNIMKEFNDPWVELLGDYPPRNIND